MTVSAITGRPLALSVPSQPSHNQRTEISARQRGPDIHPHLGSKKRRWWRKPETVIPIVISVLAASSASVTYFDQRQANQAQIAAALAAAIAARQADANSVSYSDLGRGGRI